MSNEKMARLILRLIHQTDVGKLQWEETSTSNAFQTAFSGYTVISREVSVPLQGTPDYYISILNETGQTVETVSDSQLHDDLRDPVGTMRDLHEKARRQAMGVDEAIDSILSELGTDD